MRLYSLLIVPVLATSALFGVAACEESGPSRDKDTVYHYELSGQYSNGAKKQIGARYEYGTRASKLNSKTGLVKTKLMTAGPKLVIINVLAPPSAGGGQVTCKIVVTSGGKKIATITNKGRNSTACEFKP